MGWCATIETNTIETTNIKEKKNNIVIAYQSYKVEDSKKSLSNKFSSSSSNDI
jgi:hypothetical protein